MRNKQVATAEISLTYQNFTMCKSKSTGNVFATKMYDMFSKDIHKFLLVCNRIQQKFVTTKYYRVIVKLVRFWELHMSIKNRKKNFMKYTCKTQLKFNLALLTFI